DRVPRLNARQVPESLILRGHKSLILAHGAGGRQDSDAPVRPPAGAGASGRVRARRPAARFACATCVDWYKMAGPPERYRSGHNGTDSKSVGGIAPHVGSNPTLSAKQKGPPAGRAL